MYIFKVLPGAAVGDPTHDEVRWEDLTCKAGQDTRDPPSWPRPLPHPASSPLFCCSCSPCCRFCIACQELTAPLSLNEDQLKTLINKSPRRWYPMKGPKMKEMLQFKTLLLALWLVWHMCAPIAKNAHDCSKHPKHSTLTKETIKHRSFRGVRKAPQIIIATNVPNRKYFK